MGKDLVQGLLDFVGTSPTPFHCVETMRSRLDGAGFSELPEREPWSLKPGDKRYVIRGGSSIVAFQVGTAGLEQGMRMVGAHTDSPCLKVKPQPERLAKGYWQLGVEIYGGVLLAPWFDRDLSLAGRISYRNTDGNLAHVLVDLGRPVATVPSLAIHLDRTVNEQRSINKQKEMPPVLLQADRPIRFIHWLADETGALKEGEEILDFDLCFYDTQSPAVIGANDDFVASARLDNQLSCFAGLEGLLAADPATSFLLVCNDHEEVGSQSAVGADGAFLEQVLMRMEPDTEKRLRMFSRSLFLSCDNAHGIHPNFPERHDENHGPILNRGPVIKINANQRYATTGETSGVLRLLCQRAEVPYQSFVVRADMACGSTIGPLTAARIGVQTVDLGVPTFGMHSIRELAGSRDVEALVRLLTEFGRSRGW